MGSPKGGYPQRWKPEKSFKTESVALGLFLLYTIPVLNAPIKKIAFSQPPDRKGRSFSNPFPFGPTILHGKNPVDFSTNTTTKARPCRNATHTCLAGRFQHTRRVVDQQGVIEGGQKGGCFRNLVERTSPKSEHVGSLVALKGGNLKTNVNHICGFPTWCFFNLGSVLFFFNRYSG